MKPSTRFRIPGSLLLFLLIFLLVVLLLSQIRDFLQESVLLPLMRLFWVAGLLLGSVDQICIWALVIIFAAFISITRLRRPSPEALREMTGMMHPQGRGRIRFWRGHLRANAGDTPPSRFIAAELRRLVLEVLSYRDHLNPSEVNRLAREGQIELPPEVESVLNIIDTPEDTPVQVVSRLQGLWRKALALFRPGRDRSLERFENIAQYLENTMEGMHDIRNH